MHNYILVLKNGEEFDVGSRCIYHTITQSRGSSRNQNCDVLETIAEHNNDCTFIEYRQNVLVPIKSILYIKRYIPPKK